MTPCLDVSRLRYSSESSSVIFVVECRHRKVNTMVDDDELKLVDPEAFTG